MIATSVCDVALHVAYRRRWRTDWSCRTGEFYPRGTDHGWNTVRTSTGSVLQCCHQVCLPQSVLRRVRR